MTGRTIAIGDIHGCDQEFSALLDRLSPTSDDRIILLGDLVNRGPNSRRVLEIARKIGAISLLGNHELRLLNYRRTRDKSQLKETDAATLQVLTKADWKYLEAMSLTYHLPEHETLFLHGGLLPGIAWSFQDADTVTRIQVIDAEGKAAKRADCPDGQPWADLWTGPPYVVYGHTPRPDIYNQKWSAGIDTACVLGGHLTAYILPDRRFVQVRAARRYYG